MTNKERRAKALLAIAPEQRSQQRIRVHNWNFLKSVWQNKGYDIESYTLDFQVMYNIHQSFLMHIRSKHDKLEKNHETDEGNKKHVL